MRALVTLLVSATVTGCVTTSEYAETRELRLQAEIEACSSQLASASRANKDELNSSDFRIVNWNIRKGSDPEWATDLATFADESELMIFQEASLHMDAWDDIAGNHYRAFAPGYRTSQSLTGVMTLSSVEPLAQCNLVTVEPWLRSPKATVITEYGLTATDKTLLVINIHAVNFTFGTSDFREQVQRVLIVVDDHDGPVLLSGDFNTWHWRQSRALQEMADDLGFEMLDYDEDHRKRVFGQPLDHIYVRGLQVVDATTASFGSSDHNPMSVRFSL